MFVYFKSHTFQLKNIKKSVSTARCPAGGKTAKITPFLGQRSGNSGVSPANGCEKGR